LFASLYILYVQGPFRAAMWLSRIAGRLSLWFSLYEEGVFCFVYGYFYPKAFVMIVSGLEKGKTRQKKEGRR
jgi:hypothetical protein